MGSCSGQAARLGGGAIGRSDGSRFIVAGGVMAAVAMLLPGVAIGSVGMKGGGASERLMPLTAAQIEAAGASGTGCSWSLGRDGPIRFAAADDHAVIRLASKLMRLRPAADAHDMFPFTHDSWSGDGISVSVVAAASGTKEGSEAIGSPADLKVTIRGHATSRRGRMICGS